MSRRKLRVLMIDDNTFDAELVHGHLREQADWDVEFLHRPDAESLFQDPQAAQADVILLDYWLGPKNGIDVLRALRAVGDARPVIALSENADPYAAATWVGEGADEYLLKSDVRADSLRRVIECALGKATRGHATNGRDGKGHTLDRRDPVDASKERPFLGIRLAHPGRFDPATQLLTRSAWQQNAELEHERSLRYGRPYAVFLIAVDHLKEIRAAGGRHESKECLQSVTLCLEENCRAVDVVGRWGREEFAVLAPETHFEGALFLARRICRAVQDRKLAIDSDGRRCITVSLGVAEGPSSGWDCVIRSADEALYDARRGGGNSVCGRMAHAARLAGAF